MIESWALVEADFMREYGIDLVVDLARVSLRRFMVLVRGLGPNSAIATRMANRHYMGAGPSAAARMSSSPKESEGVLAGFFGRLAGKVD